MKIQVKGYTYETGEHKVKVGDLVILPTSKWLRDVLGPTWQGEVHSLESDYDGYCETIIGVIKKPRKNKSGHL